MPGCQEDGETITVITVAQLSGSNALTPYCNDESPRASHQPPSEPRTTPTGADRGPSLKTIRRICCCDAPSAARTPNSLRRAADDVSQHAEETARRGDDADGREGEAERGCCPRAGKLHGNSRRRADSRR